MVILWRIIESCNLGCGFCAYSRELSRSRRQTDAGEIRRVLSLLGELRARNKRRILVSWLGGEPFLRDDLSELTRYAVIECGLSVSTTTNATTLGSPALRRQILDFYDELTISVDGLAAFHDRVRDWPGGFLRVEASVKTLLSERGLARRRPLVRINTVLMHDNLRAFPELAAEVAGWGIDELSFNQLGGIDRPEFHAAQRLTVDDSLWLSENIPRVRRDLSARGVRLVGGADYLLRIRATAAGVALPVADCHPGETFLFIDEHDHVSPCSFTPHEYAVPLRELRTVFDWEQLPRRFRAALKQRRLPACDDCHSTQTFGKFATDR